MSKLETITPARAAELVRDGAVLIDIRETHEHAHENIPGARHHALSQIDARHPVRAGDTVLIYHCKSGGRTNMNARRLAGGFRQMRRLSARRRHRGLEARRPADLGEPRPPRRRVRPADQSGLLGKLTALFR